MQIEQYKQKGEGDFRSRCSKSAPLRGVNELASWRAAGIDSGFARVGWCRWWMRQNQAGAGHLPLCPLLSGVQLDTHPCLEAESGRSRIKKHEFGGKKRCQPGKEPGDAQPRYGKKVVGG